jgi:hypothetical protein
MEDIEPVGRVVFVAAAGFVAGGLVTAGGLEVEEARLGRELRGAFLTPSETDARGRAAATAGLVAGDVALARAEAEVGFVVVDEARVLVGGGDAFVGTTDALRFGAAVAAEAGGVGRAEDIVGLAGAEVDFLRAVAEGTVAGAGALVTVEAAGLDDDGLIDPAPKVPEPIIWK